MVVASSNYSRIMVIIIPIQTCWLGAQTNLSSLQTPFAASIPPLWLQWNQPTHPWHLVNIVSYLNCQQLPSDAIEEVHHRSKFNQNVWIPHNCHDLFFVLVYFEVIFWKVFFSYFETRGFITFLFYTSNLEGWLLRTVLAPNQSFVPSGCLILQTDLGYWCGTN